MCNVSLQVILGAQDSHKSKITEDLCFFLTHSATTLQAGCQGHRPAVLSGHNLLDQLRSRPIV